MAYSETKPSFGSRQPAQLVIMPAFSPIKPRMASCANISLDKTLPRSLTRTSPHICGFVRAFGRIKPHQNQLTFPGDRCAAQANTILFHPTDPACNTRMNIATPSPTPETGQRATGSCGPTFSTGCPPIPPPARCQRPRAAPSRATRKSPVPTPPTKPTPVP